MVQNKVALATSGILKSQEEHQLPFFNAPLKRFRRYLLTTKDPLSLNSHPRHPQLMLKHWLRFFVLYTPILQDFRNDPFEKCDRKNVFTTNHSGVQSSADERDTILDKTVMNAVPSHLKQKELVFGQWQVPRLLHHPLSCLLDYRC